MDEVKKVLEERGGAYGSFRRNADIAQTLKGVIASYGIRLDPVYKEALEHIFTKVSRLLSKDASHVDSWMDIAGYATLAVQHTHAKEQGKELAKEVAASFAGAMNLPTKL